MKNMAQRFKTNHIHAKAFCPLCDALIIEATPYFLNDLDNDELAYLAQHCPLDDHGRPIVYEEDGIE
jgi:hypothetical protein